MSCAAKASAYYFAVGTTYPMLDRGAVLEYRTNGRTTTFPVLMEHVDFTDEVGLLRRPGDPLAIERSACD
jgi:hypothetical protein